MEKLVWEIRRTLPRPATAMGAVGVAFVFAVIFFLVAVLPAQKERDRARRLYQQEERDQELEMRRQAASQAAGDRLALPIMPSGRTLPQWLSRMFAIARELNVVLDIGEYRYSHGKDEPFGRYQIEVPMNADYPTLRVFLAKVMNEMPFIALDDLSISRGEVSGAVVEARVKMTLFLSEGVK